MIDFLCGHKAENLFIIVKRSRVELKWEQSVFSETLVWLRLKVNLGRRPHRDHRAGNFYPHMWRHASFKLLLIRRNNEPSRPITDRLGTQGVGGEWHCCSSNVSEEIRRCAGIRWRVELCRCWPGSDALTERKQSQRKPQLLFVGPFFRAGSNTIIDAVPLPERTGCRDGKALSALSQTAEICFPWVQISFCFQAIKPQLLDTQHFFYPVVQSLHICYFLLVPSSEEFYYAWPLQQRRAVVTFSFATWLWEAQRSVLYPLWGKWTKKKTIWRLTGHHFSS